MKKATLDDLDRVKAFLMDHAPMAMFPLSNLARHGAAGGHPRAVSFWFAEGAQGITDVLTVSDEGMVFPTCPNSDWAAVTHVLRQIGFKGIIGEGVQVVAITKATGLEPPSGLDLHEPHYQLSLKDIIMPDFQDDDLIPLGDVPVDLANSWREAFCEEVLHFPKGQAGDKAAADVADFIKRDTHRVLQRGGTPVAMTGFNAVLPEIVQVGGVYTPPALRGRGYARRAVSLHLAEAAARGVETAVLSAANAIAARAYMAIGFQPIGTFAFSVWPERQVPNG